MIIGISMGCSISPLLFVLAMEMVLRGAEQFAQRVEVTNGPVMTVLTGDTGGHNPAVDKLRLESLIQWCRKAFKPK